MCSKWWYQHGYIWKHSSGILYDHKPANRYRRHGRALNSDSVQKTWWQQLGEGILACFESTPFVLLFVWLQKCKHINNSHNRPLPFFWESNDASLVVELTNTKFPSTVFWMWLNSIKKWQQEKWLCYWNIKE